MTFNDELYGQHSLEPVLLELMETGPVVRLRGIEQHGPNPWLPHHPSITRYDHSVGVTFLLRRLGASLEEQVAGLLHDIGHGVFSHAMDYLFDNVEKSDLNDRLYSEVILASDIPAVLKRHGLSLERVLDHDSFLLLEQEIPDICADRIDYLLRDAYCYGLISMDDAQRILSELAVVGGEIVFANLEAATLFGTTFVEASHKVFGSVESIYLHERIAEAMRVALQEKVISKDDFLSTDAEVRAKLEASPYPDIRTHLDGIFSLPDFIHDENGRHLAYKLRYVDPKVLTDNSLVRLSELDPAYAESLRDYKERQAAGHRVRFSYAAR